MLKLNPVDKSILAEDLLARLPLVGDLYKFYRVADNIYAWSESTGAYFQINGVGAGSIPQANFLSLATHAGLDNERVFTPGENTQASDGGAGAAYNFTVKIGATSPNCIDFSTTGKSNNITPSGWNDTWDSSTATGKATVINYIGSDYAIITGLGGGSEGRICMFNNKTDHLVILEHNSTNSSSANRINSKDGIAVFIGPGRSILMQYVGGSWQVLFGDLWTNFEDFTQVSSAWTGSLMHYYAVGVSNTASALTASQYGIISAAPSSGGRAAIYHGHGGSYSPGALDPTSPLITVCKVHLSAHPSTNARLSIGYGNYVSGAGSFYTQASNGAIFGYAYDSGLANAATNWYIYSGPSGTIGAFAGGALDSGIPVSQCVNAWNVFVVYWDYKNNIYKFFHSSDMMNYTYVGQRTTRPTNGIPGFWFEATTASRPTLWCDYAGSIQKFVTRR